MRPGGPRLGPPTVVRCSNEQSDPAPYPGGPSSVICPDVVVSLASHLLTRGQIGADPSGHLGQPPPGRGVGTSSPGPPQLSRCTQSALLTASPGGRVAGPSSSNPLPQRVICLRFCSSTQSFAAPRSKPPRYAGPQRRSPIFLPAPL
ncbi:hypothetical protein NDU88_008147 [Pleurodeles waltl]|uniref:Uncharacterized protein n=1 Tax=Pleurodeles waltl TaxID=8319 RepID=A0AAV7RUY3_PLEWA|nr:hypothetical protein NDU88_008147 [Pleurodeles waltl]